MDPVSFWREIAPNYISALVVIAGVYSEMAWGNFFMIVWIPYVLMPILDYILPVDSKNVTPERVKMMEKDTRFNHPLYLVWLLDLASLYWMLYSVSTGKVG